MQTIQFNLESVKSAVEILFQTKQPGGDTKEADEFLKMFGKSSTAWMITI